ncbi:carotene biosynthesis protein [Belliella aquatica]|nr:carotene biosynthesis protein [Belliella aquatica]MCH7404699.1 carotene biosynthesis protein [Belliella aquatica]
MKNSIQFYMVILIYSIALFFLGYCLDRSDFFIQLTLFMLCFGVSLIIYINAEKWGFPLKLGLMYAFLLRMILIISEPVLSDDFYRFIFDGQLIKNGINPYLYLPQEAFELLKVGDSEYWNQLLTQMNSSGYYSVYPPLHQLFFWLAALGGEHLSINILILRLAVLLFEILNCLLLIQILKQWNLPKVKVLLYAFNPLVILELTGNLHFEGMVLFGLLGMLYFLGKVNRASILWTWAVGVKLSPLMLGPILLKFFSGKSRLVFLLLSALVIVLLFIPLFFEGAYLNFWQSFRLYQSSFEFNGSIYYLLRWISGFWLDYNPIRTLGPVLSMLSLGLILWLSLGVKKANLPDLVQRIVWIYLIYLLFQTTVHPWYLIPAFGLGILVGDRIFLAWTALVFLSYHAYMGVIVAEQPVFLLIEYVLLFVLIIWSFKSNFVSKFKSS